MIGMGPDPDLPPDHRRHPLGGPDLAADAERRGARRQQGRQPIPLLVGQFRRRPRRQAPPRRLAPALSGTPHPPADGPAGHPERLRDRPLTPAVPPPFPRAQPPAFAPLDRAASLSLHTSPRRTDRTTFSYLRGDQ